MTQPVSRSDGRKKPGSAGLAATATRSPRPCWSRAANAQLHAASWDGGGVGEGKATTSEWRSAAPKPSSSIARSRAPVGFSADGRAASRRRSRSGTAGVAWRRGRMPFERVMLSSTMDTTVAADLLRARLIELQATQALASRLGSAM